MVCAFCGRLKKEVFRMFIKNGARGADFVPLNIVGGDYCISCLSKMWDLTTKALEQTEW